MRQWLTVTALAMVLELGTSSRFVRGSDTTTADQGISGRNFVNSTVVNTIIQGPVLEGLSVALLVLSILSVCSAMYIWLSGSYTRDRFAFTGLAAVFLLVLIAIIGSYGPTPCKAVQRWSDSEEIEQVVDACERGTVAVLAECVGTVGLEDVEAEAAQAGEHAGVGADARAVFAQGDVAAVVGGRLDHPMRADGLGGAGGGDRRVRDVQGGLGGMAQQPGPGVAGEDIALDPDDSGDVGMPVGVGQFAGGIEDGDGAAFVAVAALVAAVGRPDRLRGGGDFLDLLVQGRLVVLDLNDQGDVGFCRELEMFF
jgi:hypothetical protein